MEDNKTGNDVPGKDGGAPDRAPTPEELRKEFAKTLETPIGQGDRADAETQLLMCDVQVAQIEHAVAGLEAQIASNRAEIAKCRLARAIIARRLANKDR